MAWDEGKHPRGPGGEWIDLSAITDLAGLGQHIFKLKRRVAESGPPIAPGKMQNYSYQGIASKELGKASWALHEGDTKSVRPALVNAHGALYRYQAEGHGEHPRTKEVLAALNKFDELKPRPAARAAGMVTHPGGTERLHQYWVHGEGAAKIRWGQPGDFDRCVMHLGKFIKDPKGYCNLAHHAALGIYPATHAAMEHGRAAMADSSKRPYGDVTYADPKNGKYPVDTEEHARAAWSYINQAKNAAMYPLNGVTLPEVKDRIMAACKKFGIDVSGDSDSSSGRSESLAPYTRAFPLEDISVRTTRDGRIVEAYLAVFNTRAEIHDRDGDYDEELDPVVFNRAISDARPQGSRTNWRVGVFYNHGMTIMGTPSDRHSMPVAVPMDIKTDGHGVRATDKYHRSQFCDEIVEGLESGAIPGYSFSGRFRRSDPLIPRGGFRADRTGKLPLVRRMESTLREYGPTPFPAYADAAVLGVRSDSLMAAMMQDPELALRMISAFRDGAPMDSPPPPGAPHDGDSPAEDSRQLVRSGRSAKQEIQAARSAFLQRHRGDA